MIVNHGGRGRPLGCFPGCPGKPRLGARCSAHLAAGLPLSSRHECSAAGSADRPVGCARASASRAAHGEPRMASRARASASPAAPGRPATRPVAAGSRSRGMWRVPARASRPEYASSSAPDAAKASAAPSPRVAPAEPADPHAGLRPPGARPARQAPLHRRPPAPAPRRGRADFAELAPDLAAGAAAGPLASHHPSGEAYLRTHRPYETWATLRTGRPGDSLRGCPTPLRCRRS
jgi:hypothetical protein